MDSQARRHSCRQVKLFSAIKLSSIHCFIIFICVWRVACPSRKGQRYWGAPYTTLSSALRTGLLLNLELIHIHQPVNPSSFPVSAHSMLRLQMCAGPLPDLRRVLEHRLQSSPCTAICKHVQPPSHCSSPLSSFHMTSVRILVPWCHKYLPHCPLTCGSSLFFIF